jgi:hypothetical protein
MSADTRTTRIGRMTFSGHPRPAANVSATSVFRRPKASAEIAEIALIPRDGVSPRSPDSRTEDRRNDFLWTPPTGDQCFSHQCFPSAKGGCGNCGNCANSPDGLSPRSPDSRTEDRRNDFLWTPPAGDQCSSHQCFPSAKSVCGNCGNCANPPGRGQSSVASLRRTSGTARLRQAKAISSTSVPAMVSTRWPTGSPPSPS